MRLDVLIALGMASALALGGSALAQQPVSPPAPPADYGPPITNEQAKTVAAAALAEAKKKNSPMAFAIVGPAGGLGHFGENGGTRPGAGGGPGAGTRPGRSSRAARRLWAAHHQRAGKDGRRRRARRGQEEQLAHGVRDRGTGGRTRLFREDGRHAAGVGRDFPGQGAHL